MVVSSATATSWTFTPVKIGVAFPGEHPVSGNREFGIRRNGSTGSHEIYTRAADRAVDRFIPPPDLVYGGGDSLWRSMQNRVAKHVEENKGSAASSNPTRGCPKWHSPAVQEAANTKIISDREKYQVDDNFRSSFFQNLADAEAIQQQLRRWGFTHPKGVPFGKFLNGARGTGALIYGGNQVANGSYYNLFRPEQGVRNLVDASVLTAIQVDNPRHGERLEPNKLKSLVNSQAVYLERGDGNFLVQRMDEATRDRVMPQLIRSSVQEEAEIRSNQRKLTETRKLRASQARERGLAVAREIARRNIESSESFLDFEPGAVIGLGGKRREDEHCGIFCLYHRAGE